MKIKRGDIIESECGRGKIVAITTEWIIHEIDDGKEETAICRGEQAYWIPAEAPEEDVDESPEIEVEG